MTSVNEQIISEALNKVTDPDLGKTLGELNAVEKIEIDGKMIRIYLKLVQPIHWVAERINNACVEAIMDIAPDYENEILVAEMAADHTDRNLLNGVKNIIAVSSGKGGVGKSAIASNLAAALSLKGAKVGILDGDVYGPSQPTMFGLKEGRLVAQENEDGQPVAYPLEKYGLKVASMGFVMEKDQAAIVRGPMLAGYFSMLFEQLDWGDLDFLIFDLPPGTGDIQLTLTQKIPLSGSVIVTTPQEISIADVRRSISMFNRVNVDILGIVENMSYFVPPDMPDKKYYIFGEGGGKAIAEEAGVNLLGQVPLNINMREGNDGGKPVVLNEDSGMQGEILREIAANTAARVRQLNYKKLGSGVEISL